MPEPQEAIAYCQSCKNAMDVSAVPPFSMVVCPFCEAETRVKREFGPYTLVRRLADGGMSLVFVAQDHTLGREVALKILNQDYSADERRIAAFEEEARITASFSHPHVVRVFTTGRAFGRFYIAMELVPGGHLESRIHQLGSIPELEMIPLAIQVADGLEAARAAGLIHRDVKPGNILLDAHGNAKIVDFGLALVTKGGKATAQEIWATPYYVPPETIEGQPEDFRSDLYAFGASLYHALAGKPSCNEQTMATNLLREAKRNVVPLKRAAPHLSREICQIVDRAMAYDPKQRFGSYQEMTSRLEIALKFLKSGGVAVTRETPEVATRRRSAQRTERLLMGSAGVLLLAVLGLGVLWVMPRKQRAAQVRDESIEIPELVARVDAGGSMEIGKLYREARLAIEQRDFPAARKAFVQLRRDVEVQEPTRSWAAMEAVIACYLEGDSGEARKEARAAVTHLEIANLEDKQMAGELKSVLARLSELEPIPWGAAASSTEGSARQVVLAMLAGLKEWEQGLIDPAAKWFEKAATMVLPVQDQWAVSYQKIARDYLADHALLNSPVFEKFPDQPAACKAALGQLAGITTRMKTRGRAVFNIQAFQGDLERHARLIEKARMPASVADPSQVVKTIEEYQRNCRFEDASRLIKTLAADPPGISREAYLSITESAINFLTSLEGDLRKATSPVELKLKSGQALKEVTIGEAGHLTGVKDGENRKSDHAWGDMDAESVIALYRGIVRTETGDLDRLKRHEGAIAYDWLAGDRARASLVAARLGSESDVFKRRWDSIVSGLPQ